MNNLNSGGNGSLTSADEDQIKGMTGDSAACQMSWTTPGDSLAMFCFWKANSPDDVNQMLELARSRRISQ